MVQLVAERMAAGGEALAREPSGRVVFVAGALPGERVRAEIVDEHRDYARGHVVEVLSPAPGRRTPPCPHVAEGCGGCGWQHVEEGVQRSLKAAVVAEALVRTGRLARAEVVDGPVLSAFGFRTTLRLGVDEAGRLGFRARRSHRLVALDDCPVAHPRLDELLAHRFVGAREVTMRCGARTGERVVVVDGPPPPPGTLPADVAIGPDGRYHEVVAGIRLRISARSFFQTRADGADALVDVVRSAADGVDPSVVVDAYGGVGLFAATVAPSAEVVVVESSRAASEDARHNLAARAATVVRVDVGRWRARPAELVVADPPRTGLGRPAVGALVATGAARLVLVSCDPVSLARDARLLEDAGYAHVRSTVVDLFPQTPHVEVVSRFDRR